MSKGYLGRINDNYYIVLYEELQPAFLKQPVIPAYEAEMNGEYKLINGQKQPVHIRKSKIQIISLIH